jgi:hypothetical protein
MNKKLLFVLLAPIDLFATVFMQVFVNWWAALFADETGWLPRWLTWAQTFDNSLDAGVQSGFFHKSSNTWWNRTRWLYRNPGCGFSYWVLGTTFVPPNWRVVTFEGEAGKFYAESIDGYFNYRNRFGWFAVKLGWKAWNMYDERTASWELVPWGPQWKIPIVFSISFSWRTLFNPGQWFTK